MPSRITATGAMKTDTACIRQWQFEPLRARLRVDHVAFDRVFPGPVSGHGIAATQGASFRAPRSRGAPRAAKFRIVT
jgi:hypothetical protein